MPIKSTEEAMAANKFDVLVLSGAPKVGKSSFTASGSRNAPDEMYTAGAPVEAKDVVIINIDPSGFVGAVDSGYRPLVNDLSNVLGWSALNRALAGAIMELKPMVEKGDVRVVGLDLGPIANEIVAFCAGDKVISVDKLANTDISFAGSDVNWTLVASQGLSLFRAFRQLPCLVVVQTHLKATQNNPYASKLTADEKVNQELVRDANAVGGDAGKLAADIAKGVITPWIHAGAMFVREVRDVNLGTPVKPVPGKQYVTITQGNGTYTAGSRWQSKVEPVTTKSLRYLLDKVNSI